MHLKNLDSSENSEEFAIDGMRKYRKQVKEQNFGKLIMPWSKFGVITVIIMSFKLLANRSALSENSDYIKSN